MFVASGHGLIAVNKPKTRAVIHGTLLLSNMPERNSFTIYQFENLKMCQFENEILKSQFSNYQIFKLLN